MQFHSFHNRNSLIKDYVNNNDQFTGKTVIPQDSLLDLVNLVLTTTCCCSSFKFYKQTDGAVMEWPDSSSTAETYTQSHEQIGGRISWNTSVSWHFIEMEQWKDICIGI